MMAITTMWEFVRTLREDRTSSIAEELVCAWSIETVPAYVRSSSNFVFSVENGDGRFYLRFSHESERDEAGIAQEMALLVWLGEQDIRVNQPIATSTGEFVASIETDTGRYHGVLLTAMEGGHLAINSIAPDMFAEWGSTVGYLHAVLDRAPEHLHRPPAWRSVFAEAERIGGLPAQEATALRAILDPIPAAVSAHGLIHTDLELDNLLWNGQSFGCIDVDEYTTGWRASDIAKALDEFEAGWDDPRVSAFLDGYRRHLPFSEEMRALLPAFTRLFNLGMYLRLRRGSAHPLDQDGLVVLGRVVTNHERWIDEYEAQTAAHLMDVGMNQTTGGDMI